MISGAFVGVLFLKFPFVICSNIFSAEVERFSDEVFGLFENFTWNFVSRIFFRTLVFISVDFFNVNILSSGSIWNLLIVLKTFLSK